MRPVSVSLHVGDSQHSRQLGITLPYRPVCCAGYPGHDGIETARRMHLQFHGPVCRHGKLSACPRLGGWMLHSLCPAGQQLQPQPAALPPTQPALQAPAAVPVAVPQPAAATPPGAVKASRVRVAPSAAAEERRLAAALSEAEAFTAEFRCDNLGTATVLSSRSMACTGGTNVSCAAAVW